jgi:hypothetical protein
LKVEIDYMTGLQPNSAALSLATDEFAAHGIRLHIEVDDEIPFQANLGSPFIWSEHFFPLMRRFFSPELQGTFHYCLWIHAYDSKGSSGAAYVYSLTSPTGRTSTSFVPSPFFLVSLGSWPGHGSVFQQAGDF